MSGLELGARRPLTVRREAVAFPLDAPVRLACATDLHLGNRWSRQMAGSLATGIEEARPDLILLGGDLVDSHAGLRLFAGLLARLRAVAPVAAVLGNHDRWSGGRLIRRALERADATLLAGATRSEVGGVTVVGDPAAAVEPRRTVLCVHDPRGFRADVDRGIRLTLAGHLHGGQCVLWRRAHQLWPGYLLNRGTVTRRTSGASELIVSVGAADSLPVRFNCPREWVSLDLDQSRVAPPATSGRP